MIIDISVDNLGCVVFWRGVCMPSLCCYGVFPLSKDMRVFGELTQKSKLPLVNECQAELFHAW